jgi:hypothetical protein
MSGFFEEVKRRKVYRVAVAYIIVAAGVIQMASAAFPAWELPNWALRLVIVVLLLGFPIALVLAWAYDITAQGVQATPTTAVPRAHRRRNIIMLVATGVVISAAAGFFLLPRVSARKIDKSIAVLPFVDRSSERSAATVSEFAWETNSERRQYSPSCCPHVFTKSCASFGFDTRGGQQFRFNRYGRNVRL